MDGNDCGWKACRGRGNRRFRETRASRGNQSRVEHHETVYVYRVRDMFLAARILSEGLMHVLDFPDFLVKFAFQ